MGSFVPMGSFMPMGSFHPMPSGGFICNPNPPKNPPNFDEQKYEEIQQPIAGKDCGPDNSITGNGALSCRGGCTVRSLTYDLNQTKNPTVDCFKLNANSQAYASDSRAILQTVLSYGGSPGVNSTFPNTSRHLAAIYLYDQSESPPTILDPNSAKWIKLPNAFQYIMTLQRSEGKFIDTSKDIVSFNPVAENPEDPPRAQGIQGGSLELVLLFQSSETYLSFEFINSDILTLIGSFGGMFGTRRILFLVSLIFDLGYDKIRELYIQYKFKKINKKVNKLTESKQKNIWKALLHC